MIYSVIWSFELLGSLKLNAALLMKLSGIRDLSADSKHIVHLSQIIRNNTELPLSMSLVNNSIIDEGNSFNYIKVREHSSITMLYKQYVNWFIGAIAAEKTEMGALLTTFRLLRPL